MQHWHGLHGQAAITYIIILAISNTEVRGFEHNKVVNNKAGAKTQMSREGGLSIICMVCVSMS